MLLFYNIYLNNNPAPEKTLIAADVIVIKHDKKIYHVTE